MDSESYTNESSLAQEITCNLLSDAPHSGEVFMLNFFLGGGILVHYFHLRLLPLVFQPSNSQTPPILLEKTKRDPTVIFADFLILQAKRKIMNQGV